MKVIITVLMSIFLYAETPQLFLLKTYSEDMNVTGWVMSEKLDGVRAFWDGEKLISRSGRIFNAPSSFTCEFPSFALDGELWISRGNFEHIVSITNTRSSNSRWEELTYNVFEVPNQEGDLLERLSKVKPFVSKTLRVIKQIKVRSQDDVKVYFDAIIEQGGEGIVLRNYHVPYYVGRNKKSLKYKPFFDAECTVVSILEGKGKYKNLMGALSCKYNGKLIKIGSGFSDDERKKPPKIGTLITFKYYGFTRLGNPKYSVFLRVR